MKNEGILSRQEIIGNAMAQIQNWIYRTPSDAFDKLVVWDDILTSRNMYLDLYAFRLQADFDKSLSQNRDLRDIRAVL